VVFSFSFLSFLHSLLFLRTQILTCDAESAVEIRTWVATQVWQLLFSKEKKNFFLKIYFLIFLLVLLQLETLKGQKQDLALVIDGKTLTYALEDDGYCADFTFFPDYSRGSFISFLSFKVQERHHQTGYFV